MHATGRLPTARRVYWLLRALPPVTDKTLEDILWKRYRTPPSTVRGARKDLVDRGVVERAGRTRDGKRAIWTLTTNPPKPEDNPQ